MRIRKNVIGVLFLFIFAFIGVTDVYAANMISSYQVEGFTLEEAKKRYYHALPRSCEVEEVKKTPINTMAVGGDWIAIGTKDNTVGVFDLDGEFIYFYIQKWYGFFISS